jgi:4-hydroxybenzoate polyprenyltransferase
VTLVFDRWITYQRERFPVAAHGLLIAAFSAGAMCFSANLRGAGHFPPAALLLSGFASSFLFFMQLRIADEFKDADEDARYRPYRPVQRGIVTLRELGYIGVTGAVAQIVIALLIDVRLAALLVAVWSYFALMSKEFFAPAWLRAHPIAYLLSHMLIMPLIDLYVTAFDWLVAGAGPPPGLGWFLGVGFCNGLIVELGRKIRTENDEEPGVETYSALWGRRKATAVWLASVLLAGAVSIGAALQVHYLRIDSLLLGSLVAIAAATAAVFASKPETKASKRIEAVSGIWTISTYLCLGVLPFAARVL